MELLSSIFDQLGINKTFFVQFTLVLISCFVLSKLVFSRVLNILVVRDDRTRGAKKSADELMFEYENTKRDYNAKWSVYQEKAEQIKRTKYEESRKKAEEIVKKKKEESEAFLELKRKEIVGLIGQEKDKLSKDSVAFVEKIKHKLFDSVN